MKAKIVSSSYVDIFLKQLDIRILMFFFFCCCYSLTYSQDEFYRLDSKIVLKETPEQTQNSLKLEKGEMLQIVDYFDGYLHVINEKYNGYFYYPTKKKSFKSNSAKNKINQLIFIYKNKDLLASKNMKYIPIGEVNTIIILNKLAPKVQYNDFGKYLVSKGFTFAQNDESFLTLISNFKSIGDKEKDRCRFRLTIACISDEIKIKIEYDDMVSFLYKDNIQVETLYPWSFDAGHYENKFMDLIFWDIAPVIEGYNHEFYYTNDRNKN